MRKVVPTTSDEHFGLKVAFVASMLIFSSFVAMTAELRFASPGHSLSETEIAQNMPLE